MDGDGCEGAVAGAGYMIEAVEGVENRSMRGADKLTTTRIIIDWHTLVGAGPFAGNKIAVGEADEQAAIAIGGIGEALRAICWLVGVANHRTRMRWCRRGSWRLRGRGFRSR